MKIPGTVIQYDPEKKITDMSFYISAGGGLTLSQVCSLTGLEPFTVQNWVRRGFVFRPEGKKYYPRHLSRIMMINSIKRSLPLDTIGVLFKYVNGDTEDSGDDIISEENLYGLFSSCAVRLISEKEDSAKIISDTLSDSGYSGIRDRLETFLSVMLPSYLAGEYSALADNEMKKINIK